MIPFWKLTALGAAIIAVAGCVQFPAPPGKRGADMSQLALSEPPQFNDLLIDTAGRRWQARVTDHYVSALGRECVRLNLTSLDLSDGQGSVRYEVACKRDDFWIFTRNFSAGGVVDGDLVFAPVAVVPKPES